jgi:pimeloyl-ACP methyl ester carboxylesterase
MATFVLVHGAWHGAWSWNYLAKLLLAKQHSVVTPTLTGLGERSHLLTSEIDLDTHILDVVNDMKWRELRDVVLVGHSYGGMVISGVAERMEASISSIVMLDAFFPTDGQSLIDLLPPPLRQTMLEATNGGTTPIPPLGASILDVNEKDRAWVDAQCTPQPPRIFLQKVMLTGARERIAKKAYIRASNHASVYFDAQMSEARRNGWPIIKIDAGHDVAIDAPAELASTLTRLA